MSDDTNPTHGLTHKACEALVTEMYRMVELHPDCFWAIPMRAAADMLSHYDERLTEEGL